MTIPALCLPARRGTSHVIGGDASAADFEDWYFGWSRIVFSVAYAKGAALQAVQERLSSALWLPGMQAAIVDLCELRAIPVSEARRSRSATRAAPQWT